MTPPSVSTAQAGSQGLSAAVQYAGGRDET